MSSLEAKVKDLKDKLSAAGLFIDGEKVIPYGIQLVFSNGKDKAPINIYSGKKGITITPAGSQTNPIRQQIEACLSGSPAHNQVETNHSNPPGFEGVADFDFRWIGTDESGKGDVFGPLVAAGVMVDRDTAAYLESLGIKDSKAIDDKKIRQLAAEIRRTNPGRYIEIELTPRRYNELYEAMRQQGRNLNHLLAWAHARTIEELLDLQPCNFAIADKFADERFINSRLFAKGREITLVQTPRAERNIAVAAASVLARDRFLARMDDMADRFALLFPKGASTTVKQTIAKFISMHGRARLNEVGKLHFKTFDNI